MALQKGRVIAIATTKAIAPLEGVAPRATTLSVGDELPENANAGTPAYVLGLASVEFEVSKE